MELLETVRLNMLFDVYGNLLTEAQKRVLKIMLHEGLTLTETAENLKVSRQAVLDVQKKAEKKLLMFEEKLGFLKIVEKEGLWHYLRP